MTSGRYDEIRKIEELRAKRLWAPRRRRNKRKQTESRDLVVPAARTRPAS